MPTNYERGRRAEQYAKDRLREAGATIVVRSARSLTPFDLIAFFPRDREIKLIQVKTSKKGVNVDRILKEYAPIKDYDGKWTVKTGFFVRAKDGWLMV